MSYKYILILVVVLYVIFGRTNHMLNKVQSNEKDLVCYIGSDYKVIDKDLVTDYDYGTQRWYFTNGSARNCYLEDK